MPLLRASTPSQHALDRGGASAQLSTGGSVRQTGNEGRVTRVAVVDDHAAVRIGLKSAIGAQRGLVCVGVAADDAEMAPLLYRTRPDVVVLDYHLPPANGLALCRQIKSDFPAPAVVLYSAYAGAGLLVPAIVVGADALVHKAAPPRELLEAIRLVARGGTYLPPLIPELLAAASTVLEVHDLPILDMLIDRTPPREIASTLRLATGELERRMDRMLVQLHALVAPPSRRGHDRAPLDGVLDLQAPASRQSA
jgi:DNA-binding NarL/FixJ family response regulator